MRKRCTCFRLLLFTDSILQGSECSDVWIFGVRYITDLLLSLPVKEF